MSKNNCDINSDKLFSIMVLNYNNFDYLFHMIDSICNQSYSNIELIICDDFSNYFDKDKVLDYINKKRKNIKTSIFVNKKNIGTVLTIKKYLPYLSGDYYLITSSDDAFYDNEVISNFVKYFETTDYKVITAQWIICDDKLKTLRNYIPHYKIKQYNSDSKKLLFEMCKSNRFGAGATAYKKEIFDKYEFDDSYKYLEDWPFWLNLLFNDEKIFVAPFNCLLHRSGGISETKVITSSAKQFFRELLDTFHKEIIPNINKFSYYRQWSIIDSYKFFIEYYNCFVDTSFYEKELKQIIYRNKKIRLYFYLNEINLHLFRRIANIVKFNRVLLLSFVSTVFICFFAFKYIDSNNLKLLFMIILYFLIYSGLIFLKEVRSWLKWKNIQ